jgi:hypothetical protein
MPDTAEKIYSSFRWRDSFGEVSWDLLKSLAANNFVHMDKGVNVNTHFLDDKKYKVLFPRLK